MRTLRDTMLRLQDAASSGVISEDEFKLAVRERSGRTLSQTGNLRPKRGWIGSEVNGERVSPASNAVSRPYSRSVKAYDGKPAPEVQERDIRVKYDRQMVAMGCRSALVKVVKNPHKGCAVTCFQAALRKALENGSLQEQLNAAASGE